MEIVSFSKSQVSNILLNNNDMIIQKLEVLFFKYSTALLAAGLSGSIVLWMSGGNWNYKTKK